MAKTVLHVIMKEGEEDKRGGKRTNMGFGEQRKTEKGGVATSSVPRRKSRLRDRDEMRYGMKRFCHEAVGIMSGTV